MNEIAQVVLRRRKGWQTRTTHSHLGATTQSYSRKEGLVEIINVNLPVDLSSPGASLVTLAKEEFRRARNDGRLKKTAEVGKVTTIAFLRSERMGPSTVPEAPSRAMSMTPGPRVLRCPDCGRPGEVAQEGAFAGMTYCRNAKCPKTRVAATGCRIPDPDEGWEARRVRLERENPFRDSTGIIPTEDLERALGKIADGMTAAREALEELTRLILKS